MAGSSNSSNADNFGKPTFLEQSHKSAIYQQREFVIHSILACFCRFNHESKTNPRNDLGLMPMLHRDNWLIHSTMEGLFRRKPVAGTFDARSDEVWGAMKRWIAACL